MKLTSPIQPIALLFPAAISAFGQDQGTGVSVGFCATTSKDIYIGDEHSPIPIPRLQDEGFSIGRGGRGNSDQRLRWIA